MAILKIIATGLLALFLHLILGWPWTFGAAVIGGVWIGQGSWRVGLLALLLEWGGLVLYNFAIARGPMTRMASTMGEIMGNIPGFVVVASTLSVGAGLGALGGALGTQLRLFIIETLKPKITNQK